jgi:predicted 3-demethylubiquinone-9 3-methyltransferase (glyoxalase superfamily)
VALNTLVLVEQGGKTTLTITVLYRSQEIRDAVIKSGMEHGAAECYDKLAEMLAPKSKEENSMQKITPFLWFDGKAEEAMNFYVSIFKNSKIVSANRFQLDGQEFLALNGGPQFTFSPAVSFFVNCETQQEVDELWEKLSAGGEKSRCGWLKDKYGLSWQIIPSVLTKMLGDKDAGKAKRVMEAMLQMDKIDIDRLKQAYHQG